jgi:hypothetical protein
MNKSLQEIGFKYKTDKSGCNGGTHIFDGRSLLHTYERHFKHLRELPITLLEIGILDGSSLKMWEEYFPNGKIIGLDISPDKMKYQTDRTKIYIGSQGDEEILSQIKNDYPEGFNIVIDDGSHINELTIFSFNSLYGHVKPNGQYAIEDTCCAYGTDDPTHPNFAEIAKGWPGMHYNSSDVNFNNTRKQFDDFVSPKVKLLDFKQGDVYAIHTYSEIMIFEKIK